MFELKHTICWDCENSTNSGCSWSDRFVPVDGWKAERCEEKDSYRVIECPKFKRNSYGLGMFRTEEEYLKRSERK